MKKKLLRVMIVSLVVCFAVSLFAFSVSADEISNTVLSGSYSFNDSLSSASFDFLQYDVTGTVTLFDFEIGEQESFSFTQFAIGSNNGASFIAFGIDDGAAQFPLPSDGSLYLLKSITFDSSFSVSDDVYQWFLMNQYKPPHFSDQIGSFASNMFSVIGISASSIGSNSILSIFLIGLPLLFIVIGILFTLLNRKKNRGRRGYYKRYKRR